MKKRLRKKKHLGEFAEFGRQLVITRNRQDGFDEFLDAFIEEAIEGNGCSCGGGGTPDEIDFIIQLGRMSEDPDARFSRVTAWLDARSDVESWKAGRPFDLWHGDYEDIAD